MFNSSNPIPNFGSFEDLLKRMSRSMQDSGVDDWILEQPRVRFESELARENPVLSRPERVRLFQELTKAVMNRVIAQIGDPK